MFQSKASALIRDRAEINPDLKRVFGSHEWVLEIARWMLVGVLVIAPWLYGCTRDWAKTALTEALLGLCGVCVTGFLARGRWPKLPWAMAVPMFAILVQGWGMIGNAERIFDPDAFAFYEISKPIGWLPGVVDKATSARQMLLITGLLASWIIGADLSANPQWRRRIWMTICLVGLSIVILGLAERATGAPGIFWVNDPKFEGAFFGTYRYHANAGAYINLILPLVFGALIESFRKGKGGAAKFFWLLTSITVSASAFVNVSRAAMSLTVLLLMGLSVLAWRSLRNGQQSPNATTVFVYIFLTVGGITGLAWAFGLDASLEKWSSGESLITNERFKVTQLLIEKTIPVSGWWGFGPGTFQITFPFFTRGLGEELKGIWKYAHNDYVQTVIEWGYIGTCFWAVILFGGPVLAARKVFRDRKSMDRESRVFLVCCLFAIGGISLHAIVDFPLQIPSLQFYTAVISGLLWGMGVKSRDPRRPLDPALSGVEICRVPSVGRS